MSQGNLPLPPLILTQFCPVLKSSYRASPSGLGPGFKLKGKAQHPPGGVCPTPLGEMGSGFDATSPAVGGQPQLLSPMWER